MAGLAPPVPALAAMAGLVPAIHAGVGIRDKPGHDGARGLDFLRFPSIFPRNRRWRVSRWRCFLFPGARAPPNRINVMAKAASLKIKMLSTADTGYFYVTKKNARTKTEKFTFTKYDPVARKHVEFKETKIK